MNFWLLKQEPADYPWARLVKDGRTAWTGVRNPQARNNLRLMREGDRVCYYHSGDERRVVGICRVAREAYPDPTASTGDWVCVDIAPIKPLAAPVALTDLKTDPVFAELGLVRQPRLSVMPVPGPLFERLLALGKTRT